MPSATAEKVVIKCSDVKTKSYPIETNASETNIEAGAYYFSATEGAQAKNLPIQTLEKCTQRHKQKWIISGIRNSLSEKSLNQIKEENQTNLSKRRVPKFFDFWENVAAATQIYTFL